MAFDVEGAKKAGYSDAEIADHLAKQSNFDIAGAKKAGYNDAEILQHLTAAPETAAPKAREDAIPQGRKRGGFAAQVGEAFANPAETPQALPLKPLLKGVAAGIPAAALGLPGDIASAVGVENPITSANIANLIAGPAESPAEAAGRVTGGMFGSLIGQPAATMLTPAREALAAAQYVKTANALRAAQLGLDPITPLVEGAIKAGAAGTNVLARAVETARAPFTPTANMLVPAMEGRLGEAAAALRNTGEILPGSPATAAEILAGEGFKGTQFPALQQKLLRQYAATDAEALAAQQRAAQQGALRSIGGTPAELEAAVQARKAASAEAYTKALEPIVESDPQLQAIMAKPAVKLALPAAAERAANRGRPFALGEEAPAEYMAGMEVRPQTFKEYPGQSLHDLKVSLDSVLETKSAGNTALSRQQLGDVTNARDQLVKWMESNLPEYKAARQQHAAASRDINVREVGQQLEQAASSPLNENVTRPAQFAQAVRNAPSTIKTATGQSRFTDLSQVLEAGDSQKVAKVLQEMSRTAEYERLAKLGQSQIARTGQAAELPKTPNMIGWVRSVTSRILNALEGKINERTAQAIAEAALDPRRMADMLDKAAAQAQRTKDIGAKIRAKAPTEVGDKAKVLNALRAASVLGNSDNQNAMAR